MRPESNTSTSDISRKIIIQPPTLTSDTGRLFRIQESQYSGNTAPNFPMTVSHTESIRKPIAHFINENSLFRDIVRNLWQVYKYHQEYASFLLGGCSEAEFLAIAERYAASFRQMSPSMFIGASWVLFKILDDPLTSSDLSALLNVDPHQIENILTSSPDSQLFPPFESP